MMALVLVPLMMVALVPLMSANVAAASGSVSIASPTVGYVLNGQQVHVHANFSSS